MSKSLDLIGTLNELSVMGCRVHVFGSAVVCDPPHLDTDIDYCILVPVDGIIRLFDTLEDAGFAAGDPQGVRFKYGVGGHIVSLRYDVFNFVVTTDAAWYDRCVAATATLRAMNLHDKRDRVAVARRLTDGSRSWRATFLLVRFRWKEQCKKLSNFFPINR